MIDLRSDTVTKPSEGMRKAMIQADVGDDVFADDPTVNALEEKMANLLGMESSIFVPSGTQSNLIGLLSHCERGDEFIVGMHAHSYLYEAGGAAVLGSIQPQPLEFEADATLNLEKVERYIKMDDYHFAKTRLLCIENTHHGIALPVDYFPQVAAFTRKKKLACHLDGARLFNAAVSCNVGITEFTKHVDTVSICLSKGLGAPVGSLLSGKTELIKKARRWRKMVGGGMRQAGILAAAGIYALDNNINRLLEDHDNAKYLSELLSDVQNIEILAQNTNMVYATFPDDKLLGMEQFFLENGVRIIADNPMRLVCHLDVSRNQIEQVVTLFKRYFARI